METHDDLTAKLSISDFKNFMAIPLSCPESKPISRFRVFSNPHQSEPKASTNNFSNLTTKEKIKLALELFDFIHFPTLVQFWSPTIIEDMQRLLDTSDLPFGLSVLRKGLCLFRKRCLKHRYTVVGENCGPPGRVYRGRFPEFCPDVDRYSGEEYELKDFAVACGVRGYLALPVFEPVWQCCIGVLEILTVMDGSYCLANVFDKVSDSLKAVGLRSSDVFWPFDMKKLTCNQYENGPPELELALNEIERVLDVLCNTYKLPFAQTWVVTFDESSRESFMSTTKKGSYMFIKKVSSFQKDCFWFHLRKGQGVVWKAFSSRTSCFCTDITQLSIHDYALALSARKADLTGGFAICLESTYTGNVVYIIELCLPPNQTIYRPPRIFLNSLLATMKQHFKTFKLGSGLEIGNELPVEVLKISEDDRLDSFVICETTHDDEGLNHQGNKAQLTSCRQLVLEVGASKCGWENDNLKQNTATSSSVVQYSENARLVHLDDTTHNRRDEVCVQQKTFPPLRKNGAVKTLSLGEAVIPKVLKEQCGKRLRNVADNPSVNQSTSKNLSTVPIKNRWARCKRSKVDRPLIQHNSIKEAGKDLVKSSQRDKSYSVSPLEEGPASVACLPPVATPTQNEGSIITIKAYFKDDIIKFQLSVSSGMMKLKDEVMKRLKLTAGTFEIKYLREDNVSILLDSDAGLQEYVSALRSLDMSTISLSIELIVPQTEVMKSGVFMTVKAEYKDDLIKFQLSLSAGMLALKNEMIKRLKLEAESFEIKYGAENNGQILIDSDAALQNCISAMTSLQKTTMKLLIQPVRAHTAICD